jgi:hypothetical protein
MLIRIDPAYADDLREFLRRYGEVADVLADEGADTLTVIVDPLLPADAARLEVELFLQVWRATHPGIDVTIDN